MNKIPPSPSSGVGESLEGIAKQCLGAMADMEAALKSRERDKFTQVLEFFDCVVTNVCLGDKSCYSTY